MLISRLNSTKYPWSNPATWLIIPASANPDWMDPVFLGRLAALARAKNQKITATSAGGARDTATQQRLFATLPAGQAARPGTSWHEFGLAFDTANLWLKALHAVAATASQSELLRFGLFKPLTRGNGASVIEDWHIQPIETQGIPAANRPQFAPLAIAMDIRTFQRVNGLSVDGLYGPKTAAKAQAVYGVKVAA